MFPTTDDSQTIIDCFHQAAQATGVQVRKECGIKNIKQSQDQFIIHLSNETQITVDKSFSRKWIIKSLIADPLA